MEGMLWVILVGFFALFLWMRNVKNEEKVDGVVEMLTGIIS